MKIDIKNIKPNPINDDIYSSTDLSDLVESIKENGQLEQIVINKKNEIISGHRRYYSHKQLGLKEIDCVVQEFENDIIALIEFNRSRTKSVQDILNESRFLEKEYKRKIGRGKRTDREGQGRMSTLVEVSKRVGIGTTQLKKIKSISNYEPDLLQRIDNNELSIHEAYERVREKHMKKNESTKSNFGNLFRNLLNKEEPEFKDVIDTLLTTYPYSLKLQKMGTQLKDKSVPMLEDKRTELIDNLEFLKKLPAKQEVVYKKMKEIERSRFNRGDVERTKYNIGESYVHYSDEFQRTIKWIEDLNPVLEVIDLPQSEGYKEFNILRTNIHTLEWNPNPGRILKFIVRDGNKHPKQVGHYWRSLGVITCGSDFSTLGVRDEFIGWNNSHKYDKHKLNHTSVVSSIVPVQPFGFNFLGGKLLANLSTSEKVRNLWKEKYGDVLVGNTTTSLYGDYSMYNSIPRWKKLGHSQGEILIKPDYEIYNYWKDFVKDNYPDYYQEAISQSSPKQNVINLIFKILGISKSRYKNEFNRGVYFSSFYKNTKEFLTDKIKEEELVLNDKFKSDDIFLNWWKEKAIKRYTRLYKDKKLQKDILWYGNMKKEDVKRYLASQGVDMWMEVNRNQGYEHQLTPEEQQKLYKKFSK